MKIKSMLSASLLHSAALTINLILCVSAFSAESGPLTLDSLNGVMPFQDCLLISNK